MWGTGCETQAGRAAHHGTQRRLARGEAGGGSRGTHIFLPLLGVSPLAGWTPSSALVTSEGRPEAGEEARAWHPQSHAAGSWKYSSEA